MKKRLILLVLFSALSLAFIKLLPDVSAVSSGNASTALAGEPPPLYRRVTVKTNERLTSFANLRDGVEITSSYDGPNRIALEGNEVTSLTLATADFDEDGMPDLASGHVGMDGSLVTLRRGNVDAVYPNSPEAQRRKADGQFTDAPFVSHVKSFPLPAPPDMLGAGDFDADGHWDLVAAQKGGDSLYFLPGDGRGEFGVAQRIDLRSEVTALSTGEMNRADGLTDVAVGILGPDGTAQALVFEGPEGALKNAPESFALPEAANSLAFGQLDAEYPLDLVVAAGNSLLIVHGRDRKLSLDEFTRAKVAPAVLDHQTFPFVIASMAVGDFIQGSEYRADIALLDGDGDVSLLERSEQSGQRAIGTDAWRVHEKFEAGGEDDGAICSASQAAVRLVTVKSSGAPTDDLLLIDSRRHRLLIMTSDPRSSDPAPRHLMSAPLAVEGEPVAVLPMRLNVDALNDLIVLTKEQSAPSVVLTEPRITAVVTNTSDSGPGSFREALAMGGTITFNIPGPPPYLINLATLLPPVLGGPTGNGPVTIDGTTQPGYAGSPIVVLSCAPAIISGLDIRSGGSVVRGIVMTRFNGDIFLTSGGDNIIEGNYLGVDADGSTGNGNSGSSVEINNSSNNHIGGTVVAARNVLAGNGHAVHIRDGASSTGNLIQGNYININSPGTAAVSGSSNGVTIAQLQSGNTVGGTTAGARNVLSGGTVGARLGNRSSNLLQGNFIGTDATGTLRIGNSISNVILANGPNLVGGTTPGARNVISGNYHPATGLGNPGVTIGTDSNPPGLLLIQGNYIGTQVDGQTPLPNNGGIDLNNAIASIGGITPGARNIIAFNRQYGIFGDGGYTGTRTVILGNSIHSNVPGGVSQGVGLGIELQPVLNGPFGITPNDAGDLDLGPNNLQNFPVLTSALSAAGSTVVLGTLNSTASTQYRIEFFSNPSCDPLGNGEGHTFLGSTNVTTDVSGNASISASLPVVVPGGRFITATTTAISTMTGELTETSEFSQCIQSTGSLAHKASDFDGDGKTDIAVFRPSTGDWFISQSSTGASITHHWGMSGDVPVPADYDADGKTDLAVFRSGVWFILNSSNSAFVSYSWGISTDKPVPGDYDGDGRADTAVFRPSNGTWYIVQSFTSTIRSSAWGLMGDKPVPVDFDGDGVTDIAVWRPSTGVWHILNSRDDSVRSQAWGLNGDMTAAADYDGDGSADIAVFRPSNGVWYVFRSTNGTVLSSRWGTSGDTPQPGDYDGDNRGDFAVFRPSNGVWYVLRNVSFTTITQPWGLSSDVAVASAYVIE